MDPSLGVRRPRMRAPLPSAPTLRWIYLVAGLSAGAISLAAGQSKNFVVFAEAARALVRGDDLYVLRTVDYFKYSPTFALAFLPFAWVPSWLGAPLWGLANFGVACVGIERVIPDAAQRSMALAVALLGILWTTDGDQSNLMVGGAILLALDAFERGHALTGASLIVGSGFVKIFPFVAAFFAVLFDQKWRIFLYLFLTMVAFAAAPLLVCMPRALLAEYASWRRLIAWDRGNHGWSMMTVAQDSLHLRLPSAFIQVVAAVVQAAPVALGARFGTDAAWRRTFACALLSFFVLFNHRTEYTSFVLSAIAVTIWWATTPGSAAKTGLAFLVLLVPGPLFASPDANTGGALWWLAAHRIFHPLRVVPLFIAWTWMICDLVRRFAWRRGSVPLVDSEIRDAHAR